MSAESMQILRDIITLIIGAGIFVWSLKKTWQSVSGLIMPGLRWLRNLAIADHIEEEDAKIESLSQRITTHERRRQHEQD